MDPRVCTYITSQEQVQCTLQEPLWALGERHRNTKDFLSARGMEDTQRNVTSNPGLGQGPKPRVAGSEAQGTDKPL